MDEAIGPIIVIVLIIAAIYWGIVLAGWLCMSVMAVFDHVASIPGLSPSIAWALVMGGLAFSWRLFVVEYPRQGISAPRPMMIVATGVLLTGLTWAAFRQGVQNVTILKDAPRAAEVASARTNPAPAPSRSASLPSRSSSSSPSSSTPAPSRSASDSRVRIARLGDSSPVRTPEPARFSRSRERSEPVSEIERARRAGLRLPEPVAQSPLRAGSAEKRAWDKGVELINDSRHKEALPFLNLVVKLRPDWALGYSNRASCRRGTGDLEGALADCAMAQALDPSSPSPYQHRAKIWIQLGEQSLAERDSRKALSLLENGEGFKTSIIRFYDMHYGSLKGRVSSRLLSVHRNLVADR